MKIDRAMLPAELAVGWLTTFLVGTELFVFSPLLPILTVQYGVSYETAGLCVTTFSVAYMASAPLLGYVADRVGKRQVLICCLLAFGAANLFTAFAGSFPLLLAARLFSGATAAGISPSIYALVGDAAPPGRRATWLALAVSGLLISLGLGASPIALVAATFGGAPVFAGFAAFSFALASLNWRVWADECSHGEAAGQPLDHPAVASLIRQLMPMVLWSTGLYGVYTYLGAGLVTFGFSKSDVSFAIVAYGCGAIAGTLIGGRLADLLGAKSTVGISLASLCICFLLLALALRTGSLVDLGVGLSAAAAQLFFPAQQAGLASNFPARRGTALAWNNSALFLGISLGSLIGGKALAIGSFDITLIICSLIALTGCVINWAVVPGPIGIGPADSGHPK